MSTVKATNFQNASSATANMVTDASGNVSFGNAVTVTGDTTITGSLVPSSSFLRNRIINGDMRVFQRGANATTNASYSVDRWALGFTSTGTTQLGQSQLFPAGYTSSLIFDVGTADTSIAAGEHAFMYQPIEGNNIFDLSWGGASAKSVTLSFWVYTTTIGTFCVALRNSPATLSYIAEYTVNVANTWEYKTVTVPGPTTGTWATDNATGLIVAFTVAVGTTFQTTANAWNSGNFLGTSNQVNLLANTANEFRVTGVQLEVGTVATPFERQIYSNQFAQCMRYYIDARQSTTGSTLGMTGNITNGTNYHFSFSYPVPMRASPTLTWVEWTSSGFPGTSATFQQTGYLGSNVYKNANATISGGYFLGGYTASAEL